MVDRRTFLAASAAASAGMAASVPAAGAAPPTYFVIQHSPGPAWRPGVDFRQQPGLGEHGRYYSQIMDKGLIVMGGPFLDNSGGMQILSTATEAEAQAIAAADPGVKSGLLTAKVRPWMAAFVR